MINKKDVQHIAKLARIDIVETEEEKFAKDLSSILEYFNFLQELNVSVVQPTFHPNEKFLKKEPETMREDEEMIYSNELAAKLIQAAPETEKKYIKVKSVF